MNMKSLMKIKKWYNMRQKQYYIDTPLLWANLPNEYKLASPLEQFK